MSEKIEASGDALYEQTQNKKLREELEACKRRENRLCEGVEKLKGWVINLERELNSIKEGRGPYPPQDANARIKQARKEPLRGSSRDEEPIRKKGAEPLSLRILDIGSGTPGCSSDPDYMRRLAVGTGIYGLGAK